MPINKLFGSTTLRNLIQARTVDSNIKVVFGSKGGSKTDGRTIYVADLPDSADKDIRLLAEKSAYHEAEHVRALDEYRKTNPSATIPGLIKKMQDLCRPEHAALAANVWNAIEDARIDNTENDRYPGTIEKYRDATKIYQDKLPQGAAARVPPPVRILLMLWYKARNQYYAKHGVDGVPSIFSTEDEELFDQTLGSILPKIEHLTGIDDSIDLAKEAYDKIVEAFKTPPQQQGQDESNNNEPKEDTDVDGDDTPPDGDSASGTGNSDRAKEQGSDKHGKLQPADADEAGPESESDESGMDSDGEDVDDTSKPCESDPGSVGSDGGGSSDGDQESDETEDQTGDSSSDEDASGSVPVPDGEQTDDDGDSDQQGSVHSEDPSEAVQAGGSPSDPGEQEDSGQETDGAQQEAGSSEGGTCQRSASRAKGLDEGPKALECNPELDINGAFTMAVNKCSGSFYTTHPDVQDYVHDSRKPTHEEGHLMVAYGNRFFAGTEGKIRRLLVDERAPKVRDSLRSGHKLDSRHLYRTAELKMGKMPMVWKDTQEGRKIDTAVSIIIDQSGSMQGDRWCTVAFLTASLCKILDSLSVKYSVVGVDSTGSSNSRNKEGERVDSYKSYRYNSWGTRLNPNSIPWRASGGGTPTAEMVKVGLTELGARSETRKVLMVMTDGEPAYSGDNEVNSYAIDFCAEKIKTARKYGCKVFGFGIDVPVGKSCDRIMQQIFGKGWVDLPNFTQDANKHASRIMQKLEEAFRE